MLATMEPLAAIDTSLGPLRSLPRGERARAAHTLHSLAMNTGFARAVLEHDAPGVAFTAPSGRSLYVVHGYGMSLLHAEGSADDGVLTQVLRRARREDEWLQLSSPTWADRLRTVATEAAAPLEEHVRMNFRFCRTRFQERRRATAPEAVRMGPAEFEMQGSVVPRRFWPNAQRFLEAGAGFAVWAEGEVAAVAFASWVTRDGLELGVETRPRWRGRGFAAIACSALIEHALSRGLEPVWSCRLGNSASHRLAESLGFVATHRLPYFKLSNER